MNKYGVVLDKDKKINEKTGSAKDACPKCEEPLEKDTNVDKCSDCGTEPFEKSE